MTLRPVPAIASRIERAGPTTWVADVRDDLQVSDGRRLDARVVKATFDHVLDASAATRQHATFAPLVADVDLVDGHAVRIETRVPYAPMLERLTALAITGGDAMRGSGSGPYRIAASGDGATALETNALFSGARPAFERVTYRHVPDGSAARRLLDGELDVVTALPLSDVPALESAGAQVIARRAPHVLELRMDALGRGGPTPFTDRRVRRAVAHAIDVARIAREVLAGYAEPIATSVVPTMFGYDASVRPYSYDPSAARRLIADAGYADGFETVFHWLPASVWPNTAAIVEAIARDLAAVGIRATLAPVTAKEMSGLTKTGRAGPLFIRNDPNGGAYDGSFAFFYLRSRYPYAYYWSDALEELIVRAETAMQDADRIAALHDAQRLLKEESPYVWLFAGFTLVAARAGLDLGDAFVGTELRPAGVR